MRISLTSSRILQSPQRVFEDLQANCSIEVGRSLTVAVSPGFTMLTKSPKIMMILMLSVVELDCRRSACSFTDDWARAHDWASNGDWKPDPSSLREIFEETEWPLIRIQMGFRLDHSMEIDPHMNFLRNDLNFFVICVESDRPKGWNHLSTWTYWTSTATRSSPWPTWAAWPRCGFWIWRPIRWKNCPALKVLRHSKNSTSNATASLKCRRLSVTPRNSSDFTSATTNCVGRSNFTATHSHCINSSLERSLSNDGCNSYPIGFSNLKCRVSRVCPVRIVSRRVAEPHAAISTNTRHQRRIYDMIVKGNSWSLTHPFSQWDLPSKWDRFQQPCNRGSSPFHPSNVPFGCWTLSITISVAFNHRFGMAASW